MSTGAPSKSSTSMNTSVYQSHIRRVSGNTYSSVSSTKRESHATTSSTETDRLNIQSLKSGENFSANRSISRLSELERMHTWHSTIPPQISKSTILIW